MKKPFLALLLLGASAGTASAQVEIGLKLSPSVTYLRADSPSSSGFQNQKSKLSIGGGIIVDYFFGQNYAFSSGLLLTGRGGTIRYLDPIAYNVIDPNDPAIPRKEVTQKIGLQYLEVPLTLKLFTNDVATDTKVYFQLGGSIGALIGGRLDGEKHYTDPANGHATVLVGTGVEYQLGQSTKVFGGFSYHRGLVNIDKYFDKTRGFKDVTLKNNEIALDLGLKF
jgi:hypothetical protein